MYNVSANFHTLAIQDAPKTRVRIYFIGSGVDCTDDNDVTTNGTLLCWGVGDTDSNRRIGQAGIKFTEYYNPEYNVTIGSSVSSQVEMTLLNTDGGLDNFTYGRCKIYLDVYDDVNTTWLACPMGVYIIEQPTRRKSQLIHAFGYDQMQKLDEICDSWWANLNFGGFLTLYQILNSMASQLGVSVSSATSPSMLNHPVTYFEPPFDCVEMTYRDVIEYIAEATGTVARFDRNGALDLKWFKAAQISGNTVEIDTDTVGNQCLAIDLAEYQVAAIDLLKVKTAENNGEVLIGTGTNQYTILNNLFLNPAAVNLSSCATEIYNRLSVFSAYVPIQTRLIWDWSIEAGDIVKITRDNTTYTVPIFQQTMTWRGGYVVSEMGNTGDQKRPVSSYDERSSYRTQYGISANEIIDKISQSTGAITLETSSLNLSNGVLDVFHRRCYATLSSAGWYRVLKTADVSGTIIDLYIGRSYGNDPAETHKISIHIVGGGKTAFIGETSDTNTLCIDKIRCNYGGGFTYVDIHYNTSLANEVLVYFDVYGKGQANGSTISMGLASVAASPNGEANLIEHSFVSHNSPVGVTDSSNLITSGTIAASGTLSYTATQPCWVYLMFIMQANSNGSINVKIDNVNIINWSSGEAVPVNFSFLPIPLMKGNTLYVSQSSNRSSTYSIFAMR